MKTNLMKLAWIMSVLCMSLVYAGCTNDRDTEPVEPQAERIEQSMEEAGENIEEGVEETGDEIEDAVD